jgi:hypothetical protein
MPDARVGLGRPEQTAGGLRGAKPPGLGVPGVTPRAHSAWLTEDMLKPSTRNGGMAERVK